MSKSFPCLGMTIAIITMVVLSFTVPVVMIGCDANACRPVVGVVVKKKVCIGMFNDSYLIRVRMDDGGNTRLVWLSPGEYDRIRVGDRWPEERTETNDE